VCANNANILFSWNAGVRIDPILKIIAADTRLILDFLAIAAGIAFFGLYGSSSTAW
jgi:hypothetical protein